MKENKNITEEEIDLRELFQIVWNKKVFIIFFTLCITIISAFYIYSKTPIFEVKSHVELGYINKEIIEDINSLEQKLKVVFSIEDVKSEANSFEKGVVTSIKQVKGVKNFLEIKTEAFTNEVAIVKNKEVLEFIQDLSVEKIKEYKTSLDNSISDTKREIDFIQNVNVKDIKSQINIIKEQEIKDIDRQIDILKTQNIKNIDREINLLKSQEVPTLKKHINFLSKTHIKSLENKIEYYSKNLQKYISETNKINQYIEKLDNTSSMIASVQILNYQNLITNAQNEIKDLELKIEVIKNETIPKLEFDLENITTIKIKDLEDKKKNILNIDIKNLENKKINISNELIRKLEDKINVEFQTKIYQLNEKMDIQNFKKSEQNLANTKLVGEYLVNNFPVKPKKSLVIVVSFVTGFIVSIFLVFLLNFINNPRKES